MFFIKYLYPSSVALNVSSKTSIDDPCTMGGLWEQAVFKPIVTITLKNSISWQILLHGETRNWVFDIFSEGKYTNLSRRYQVFLYGNINIYSLCFCQEANHIEAAWHMTRVVCFSSLRSHLWPVEGGNI